MSVPRTVVGDVCVCVRGCGLRQPTGGETDWTESAELGHLAVPFPQGRAGDNPFERSFENPGVEDALNAHLRP